VKPPFLIDLTDSGLVEAQEAARAQGQQLLEQFVSDARFMAGQRHIADMSMYVFLSHNIFVLIRYQGFDGNTG
jgi:hypothetical protein